MATKKPAPVVYTGAIYTPPTTSLDYVQQIDTLNRILTSGFYSILRPPKDWVRINKWGVAGDGASSPNVVTMYTVPTGKQFMLMGANLINYNIGSCYLSLYDPTIGVPYLSSGAFDTSVIPVSASFAIPMILKGGDILKIESYGIVNSATGSIWGYEYPISSNPSLL